MFVLIPYKLNALLKLALREEREISLQQLVNFIILSSNSKLVGRIPTGVVCDIK